MKGEYHYDNVAYVDGSYNKKTKEYGYGVVIKYFNEEYYTVAEETISGKGSDTEWSNFRNVSGEVMATIKCLLRCQELNLSNVLIYHDYLGIAKWANDEWKANTNLTRLYKMTVKSLRETMKIGFKHVKAHSSNKDNDFVDKLAKSAVGLS